LNLDRNGLISFIRKVFNCDWCGLHGIDHWNRVAAHGRTIGSLQGLHKSDLLIVELFSYLHDACRQSEGIDRNHGQRAAVMAFDLNGLYYDLSKCNLDRLCDAIAEHSFGGVSKDVAIQTCWDADRLDLGRVGIFPSQEYLSPIAAGLVDSALELNRH
jgi:uncharacterized protein